MAFYMKVCNIILIQTRGTSDEKYYLFDSSHICLNSL